MVKTFTLSNGIKVVTYKIPQVKSLHISLAVKSGGLVEEKSKNGVAHFMEHMLVQGIPSFKDVESLSTHIEGLAGGYNAYTSQLLVVFGISVPFLHIEQAFKIASEILFEPLFPENVIEKERKAVISEITQRKDSLSYKLGKYFKTVRFEPLSCLHQEIGGDLEIVKKLTRQDFIDYWEKYFFPENTYIYVGGNFIEEELMQLFETYFSKYKNNNKKFIGFPKLDKSDFAIRNVFLRNDPQLGANYITFSFPSISLDDDWKLGIKQDIALTILGQLRTSRLFKLLRYQKGLVYNVASHSSIIPGIGYIDISSETDTKNLEEVISLIALTLKDYMQKGPTQKELDFVKNYYKNSWLMAFDNPSSVADWLEDELLWEEKVRMPEDYIAEIDTILQKDILYVMSKYWDMEKLQLVIQGPILDSKIEKEKFEKIINIL